MLYIIEISCHKSIFPVDNVPASLGKKTAWIMLQLMEGISSLSMMISWSSQSIGSDVSFGKVTFRFLKKAVILVLDAAAVWSLDSLNFGFFLLLPWVSLLGSLCWRPPSLHHPPILHPHLAFGALLILLLISWFMWDGHGFPDQFLDDDCW